VGSSKHSNEPSGSIKCWEILEYVCMYVCIRGGLLQPVHLDPQWSIVLNPYDR
jgi:hypothetical protein